MEKPEGLNIEFIKNECNVGLVSQFNKLKEMFNDTLIVVQAGDDMSKPQRLENNIKPGKSREMLSSFCRSLTRLMNMATLFLAEMKVKF